MKFISAKGALALTFLVLAVTIANSQTAAVPEPGAIQAMLNIKYLNNIFGMVFPITVQRMVQDKTIDINYSDSGIGYRIKIQDIIVQSIYFKTKTISYIPGTNDIRLKIDGLNLGMQVDGAIYALWFIPLNTGSVNITNISL